MVELILPYPPPGATGNHSVKHFVARGRMVHKLTDRAKDYRDQVALAVIKQRARLRLAGPLSVSLWLNPPDNARRDAGNVTKTLYDNLTLAGLWVDDSNRVLRREHIEWGDAIPGGRVTLRVTDWADSREICAPVGRDVTRGIA